MDEFAGELDDGLIEELRLVDADDFDVGEQRVERLAEVRGVGDGDCLVGLRAVRGDRGAVIAEVDVGLEAGNPLVRDPGALEAADKLFALAGKHGAGNDFNPADFRAADFVAAGLGSIHDADTFAGPGEWSDASEYPTRNPAVDFAYVEWVKGWGRGGQVGWASLTLRPSLGSVEIGLERRSGGIAAPVPIVQWLGHRPFTAVIRVRIPLGTPLFFQ